MVSFRDIFTPSTGSVSSGSSIPAGTDLVSPWQGDTLAQIVYSDHFNPGSDIINRTTAMQVPAVARGRSLIVSAIADAPLVALRKDERLETQPTWLYRSSTAISPWQRMAMTVDDLIFHGVSLWAVERGADGFPIDAMRVPFDRWRADATTGVIYIDNQPVERSQVCVIPGPFEGLLATGQETIRGARALERAWISRVKNPVPIIELHQTDGTIKPEEAQALLATWNSARQNPDGATAFTSKDIQVIEHGGADAQLFIEGRNAIRVDIGNLMAIPANLLDGSVATASLTYTTEQGTRNTFLDTTIRYWLAPIEHALSQDDMTPRGTRIRADLTDLLQTPASPTGETTED